mmetsp:Transcript_20460/g.45136  ORF Transcript_20460/g.45136 Transcript_20460/m.45136 type:complete len:527 (+) Transcript_20460:29-1609(+)
MEVEKTYELILKKKEEQLSRDALLERQATQLTKYFIRARQRELKDTVEKQVEQSRKHYERNLQKTRAAGEAAAAVAQMVQEEKVIISTHMAEKGKERLAEEHRVKSERREREKWQQARILYERFQAEERVRLRQEVEKERLKKLQDSLAKHAENIKDHRQNEAEEIKARRENNAKRAELVHGSRREKQKIRQKDAKQTIGVRQRKMEAAEHRRQDLHLKVQEACREQMETVWQKVDVAERKKEEKRQERHQTIIDKAIALQERLAKLRGETSSEKEDESSGEGHELSPRKQAGVRGSTKESHADSKISKATEKKEVVEEEALQGGSSQQIISYDSKELIVANSKAHKDYVQRCGKIQQAGFDMQTKKHFKVLADAAVIDEKNDPPVARMRSLHAKHIMEGPKRRQRMQEATASGSSSARTPRQMVPTCGLCERRFPLKNLIGSALNKTLQKVKEELKGSESMEFCSTPQASAAVVPTSQTATERPADAQASQAEDKILPGVRLYDTEIPLCAACYHRVRICSSSKV